MTSQHSTAEYLLRAAKVVVGLLPIVLALVLWQIFGAENDPRFPRPSTWVGSLEVLIERGLLGSALLSTTVSFVLALVISIVLGSAIGMLTGSLPVIDRATGPFFEFLRVTPPAAVIPIALLLIGASSVTTILVAVFAAIWPILLNTSSAVRSMPPIRFETVRTLSLSRLDGTRKIVLPSLIPGIALGVRIATPIALVVVLVAEMLASTGGIGQLLLERQRAFDASAVFGLLFVVGALGLVVNTVINVIERGLSKNFSGTRR